MPEQLGDLIQAATGIGEIAAERVPQLTRPQQHDDLLVPGPVDHRLGLVQTMPGPHPPRHPALVHTACLRGKVTIVGQPVD